jgi:hypothetical protein
MLEAELLGCNLLGQPVSIAMSVQLRRAFSFCMADDTSQLSEMWHY